ncbi:MAG: hypothetical protein ACK46G_02005 [Flavobacteriales bacterium]|jgi:hypothetical protein
MRRPLLGKHKRNLHDLFNKRDQIDRALREAMDFFIDRGRDMLEIFPGVGNDHVKKKALCILRPPDVTRTNTRKERPTRRNIRGSAGWSYDHRRERT